VRVCRQKQLFPVVLQESKHLSHLWLSFDILCRVSEHLREELPMLGQRLHRLVIPISELTSLTLSQVKGEFLVGLLDGSLADQFCDLADYRDLCLVVDRR
jgi:hypothetical protein